MSWRKRWNIHRLANLWIVLREISIHKEKKCMVIMMTKTYYKEEQTKTQMLTQALQKPNLKFKWCNFPPKSPYKSKEVSLLNKDKFFLPLMNILQKTVISNNNTLSIGKHFLSKLKSKGSEPSLLIIWIISKMIRYEKYIKF